MWKVPKRGAAAFGALTATVFGVLYRRLRRANRRVADALESSERANEKLKRVLDERRIFAALIDNSSDFIGIADKNGKPVYVNSAGRRMVGLAADYPIEQTQIADYYPPEVRPFASDVIVKAMLEHGQWQGETFFRHWQTEEKIAVSDTHFMIRDPETGELLGMGTITRDISDKKRALEQAEANRKLVQANEEISRLYETARRATQARDEVLAVVAHDLRNPLGTILMHASRLAPRRGEPERRATRPVEAITRAATRMNTLIQDLVDVARLESGQVRFDCRLVPAAQIVADVVETQKVLANSTSIELTLDAAAPLPEVWADPNRVRQVLENLIGNALKFTQRGGRVVVGARRCDGEVLFSVADTGAGIAAEDLPHVFDRFWQMRKGDGRGAGLGLPIAKGIVEAHHGSMCVESAPGRGSTFYFTLPTCAPLAGT